MYSIPCQDSMTREVIDFITMVEVIQVEPTPRRCQTKSVKLPSPEGIDG